METVPEHDDARTQAVPGASLHDAPVERALAATAKRLLLVGALLAAVVCTVQTIAHLVNHFAFDGEIFNLDADAEGNAFTWANSVAMFAAGFAALVIAIVGSRRRWQLVALASVLVLFSLDDAVQIHERFGYEVGQALADELPFYVSVRFWLVVYMPLLVAAAWLLWVASREADREPRLFIRAGLGMLVAAIVVEAAGLGTKWLETRGVAWPDASRIALEEALELGGMIVIAAGLSAAAYLAVARHAITLTRRS